jgi:DtxR family transcriptional regulator, Mn-dependent transcriptional regulator
MAKSDLRQQLNLSEAVEDYLKSIYQLREELRQSGQDDLRVTTNALAARLGVAAGSVTGMIKKLAEHQLVTHTPYYGVELTPTGEHLALELVRHHRLIELYLTHIVGFSWDEVHEQADALEHAISEEFEDRIDALLGSPTSDPHGDPIPTKEGQLVAPPAQCLATITPDQMQRWTITRVLTQDSARLRYLAEMGLVPGVAIILRGREPFGGPLQLSIVTPDEATIERQVSPEIAGLVQIAATAQPKIVTP